MSTYCLRWQQFCRIHKLPLDTKEHNHLYITWVQEQWNRWANQSSRPHYRHSDQDHYDFDEYLKNMPEVKNAIS